MKMPPHDINRIANNHKREFCRPVAGRPEAVVVAADNDSIVGVYVAFAV